MSRGSTSRMRESDVKELPRSGEDGAVDTRVPRRKNQVCPKGIPLSTITRLNRDYLRALPRTR